MSAVFIAAGVLQWVDNKMTKQSVKDENACSDTGCMTFFDAFWLMIVTVGTQTYTADWLYHRSFKLENVPCTIPFLTQA